MAVRGKYVVLGVVGLVIVNMVAVLLWPEGKDEAPKEPAEAATSERAPRITARSPDGTVEVTLGSPERAERVEAAGQRREGEEQRVEALGSGFAAFVDDGRPLTAAAMERPRMDGMVGGEPEYDASIEAQQRFAAFEQDLLAAVPLNPEKWRQVTKAHQDDIKSVFKRSMQLTAAGHADGARTLIEEWGELQAKYQAQAYGRAPQPVAPAAE